MSGLYKANAQNRVLSSKLIINFLVSASEYCKVVYDLYEVNDKMGMKTTWNQEKFELCVKMEQGQVVSNV